MFNYEKVKLHYRTGIYIYMTD